MVVTGVEVPSGPLANICSLMWRTEKEFRWAHQLARTGLSDYKIAEITGVSRGTVQRWRHRTEPPAGRVRSTRAAEWAVPEPRAYCYLLGCYLGDGHLTHRPPSGWTLRVAADQRYNAIAEEILAAMALTFPGGRPTRFPSSTGASDVLQISYPAIGR